MDSTGRAVPTLTFYEAVGGEPTFTRLVARFYEGVAADPPLRALYPEEDLAGATERLTLFLTQYWGGPRTYSETRGHPRLRMRHAPFSVTPDMRDRWLRHMRDAVDSLGARRAVRDDALGLPRRRRALAREHARGATVRSVPLTRGPPPRLHIPPGVLMRTTNRSSRVATAARPGRAPRRRARRLRTGGRGRPGDDAERRGSASPTTRTPVPTARPRRWRPSRTRP